MSKPWSRPSGIDIIYTTGDGTKHQYKNLDCFWPLTEVDYPLGIRNLTLYLTVKWSLDRHYFSEWVMDSSPFGDSFRSYFGHNRPIEINTNRNVNYVLGSMIVLRHAIEFPDWHWDRSYGWGDFVRLTKENETLNRLKNHSVFNKSLVAPDKVTELEFDECSEPLMSSGYKQEDINIQKYFNKGI